MIERIRGDLLFELGDVLRIDETGAAAGDDFPDDVEVSGLAQPSSVPGQLGPKRRTPRGIERQSEGPQVGPDPAEVPTPVPPPAPKESMSTSSLTWRDSVLEYYLVRRRRSPRSGVSWTACRNGLR